MQVEVSQALQGEDAIDVDQIPDNTIAVIDFDGTHLNAELAPLARGLAEFTTIDLAKVKSLRVVDRLKIDMIIEELKLSASSAVDPSTAPRMGKLLGAKHIVGGAVMDMGATGLRLDGVLINIGDSSSMMTAPAEGKLNEIFRVQKDFVFSILADLDITLTAAERDAISEVPTESYLAFLAYCRGLDFQKRGFQRDAQASFQQAVQHDQGFGAAENKAISIDAALSLGGDHSLGQFETAMASASEPVVAISGGLDSRLQQLSGIGGTELWNRPSVLAPPGFGQTATVIIRVNLNVALD
jgi:TolB-like protein